MIDGFYKIEYEGRMGRGYALLIFNKGVVAGTDAQLSYDGSYLETLYGTVDLTMTVTVPPGADLVQGVPARPFTWSFKIESRIFKKYFNNRERLQIGTEVGPAVIRLIKLRNLPW